MLVGCILLSCGEGSTLNHEQSKFLPLPMLEGKVLKSLLSAQVTAPPAAPCCIGVLYTAAPGTVAMD